MFQNCTALRNELDDQHKIRMESFEIKMKPIIIRDGPSRKVVNELTKLRIKLNSANFFVNISGQLQNPSRQAGI